MKIFWVIIGSFFVGLGTMHEVNMEIKKRFDQEKLSFAFPTRTIHLKK